MSILSILKKTTVDAKSWLDSILSGQGAINNSPVANSTPSGIMTQLKAQSMTFPVNKTNPVIQKNISLGQQESAKGYYKNDKVNTDTNIGFQLIGRQASKASIPADSQPYIQKAQESMANVAMGATSNLANPKLPAGLVKNPEVFQGFSDLSTKLLEKLKGRAVASKQFISDLAKMPDLKKVEKDLIKETLENIKGGVVNIKQFADDVRKQLLPLNRKTLGKNIDALGRVDRPRYESIVLPTEIRGNVANYYENVYESPIKTSAGGVHYPSSDRYFGHTRVEDMANTEKAMHNYDTVEEAKEAMEYGKTQKGGIRRVIEVQSDLYQKDRLKNQLPEFGFSGERDLTSATEKLKKAKELGKTLKNEKTYQELSKLEQYNNPTAHFRMVREEVAQAVKDGKTKLQFPTGETAMQIEGLTRDTNSWSLGNNSIRYNSKPLEISDLKVGQEISNSPTTNGNWIITEVLGDGKFKAVTKREYDNVNAWKIIEDTNGRGEKIYLAKNPNTGEVVSGSTKEYAQNIIDVQKENSQRLAEQFDISGKIDTSNPIYKFYEKDLGKYLSSKYGAKLITDKQGVKWFEIDLKPEYGNSPVEAFGFTTPKGLLKGSAMLGAGIAGNQAGMNAKGLIDWLKPKPAGGMATPEEKYNQDYVNYASFDNGKITNEGSIQLNKFDKMSPEEKSSLPKGLKKPQPEAKLPADFNIASTKATTTDEEFIKNEKIGDVKYQPTNEEIEKFAKDINVTIDNGGDLTKNNGGVDILAIRNNNPGNLKYAGQPNAVKNGEFAKFTDKNAGFRAVIKQVQLDQTRNLTIREFVTKYAPPTENDTEKYIDFAEERLGLTESENIANINSIELAKVMAWFESHTVVN